jgi:hypothetical protein
MYLQYQNTPKFTDLLDKLTAYLLIPINQFYEHFFNLDTADTQGLKNWGVILNQGNVVLARNYDYVFGFNNGTAQTPPDIGYPQNFGHGNWAVYYDRRTLTDDQYRILLKLTYLNYITNNSLASCVSIVNTYIQEQYNNPDKYCTLLNGNMIFTYHFNFALTDWEVALFKDSHKLPTPAGIGYNVTWDV